MDEAPGQGRSRNIYWWAAVATILTLIATVVIGGLTLGQTTTGERGKTAGPRASGTDSRTGGSTVKSPETSTDACWTSDRAPSSCNVPHRFAAVDASCEPADVIRYLGGRPDLDVVHPTVVSGFGAPCVLDLGVDWTGSVRGALATAAGDAFRTCYSKVKDVDVPCDEPHVGEYVATGSEDLADAPLCIAAADRYLETSIAQHDNEIRVEPLTDTHRAARCLIVLRLQNQTLNVSLRRLGAGQVPIGR